MRPLLSQPKIKNDPYANVTTGRFGFKSRAKKYNLDILSKNICLVDWAEDSAL